MLRLKQLAPAGLEPVDLTLEDGACLTISGPSGAGKTVFLRAIADLDSNSGDAETRSLVRSQVEAPAWRRAVAYVPAESGWWADTVRPHMTGETTTDLLHAVGLDQDCLDWQISRLSTGERQRLALVRVLQNTPEVLLLDEPTSALDAESTAVVEALISDYQSRGATVIMVTHDAEQQRRLSSLSARIDNGRVEFGQGEAGS